MKYTIKAKNLFPQLTMRKAMEKLHTGGQVEFLRDILLAFEGKIEPLGRVFDHLIFRN